MVSTFAPAPAHHWNWLVLTGPDARDFLHRVTTVNVNTLAEGEGAPGFFLTAQGKVRAYFHLWRLGREDFAFELDGGTNDHWKQELLAAIDQFTFAEKMTLGDVSAELECHWILAGTDSELTALGLEAGQTASREDGIRLCHQGDRDFGRPWITVWGMPGRVAPWLEERFPDAEALTFEQLEAWRVEVLRPRVDVELTSATIPLEIGLKDGIADNKGCYPGQEVIEKIVALGAPPRRLARIDGSGEAPAPGEKIMNLGEPAAEVGEVTSIARSGDRFSALAMIRKIHAKEGLNVRFSAAGSRGEIVRVAPYV